MNVAVFESTQLNFCFHTVVNKTENITDKCMENYKNYCTLSNIAIFHKFGEYSPSFVSFRFTNIRKFIFYLALDSNANKVDVFGGMFRSANPFIYLKLIPKLSIKRKYNLN